jgi:hypothetical protein
VRDYQIALHPESRRAMKAAILALPSGDTKPLTDEYAGYHRLRIGQHRVIYRHTPHGIECFYAAPRATVYEYLAAHIRDLF